MIATPAPIVHQAQIHEIAFKEAAGAAGLVAPMCQVFRVRNVKNSIAPQPKSLKPGDGCSRWAWRSSHGVMPQRPNRRLTTSKHNCGHSYTKVWGSTSLSNWYTS